jgi:hypothetical protein
MFKNKWTKLLVLNNDTFKRCSNITIFTQLLKDYANTN